MPMRVGDIIVRQARINAKKIGLVDGDKRFTYREINERVNRLANALIRLGLRKGAKVALMASNCHEFAETFFACAKAGMIIIPINARFNASEIAYTLNHSESDAFIYQDDFEGIAGKARDDLTTVKHFLKTGGAEKDVLAYENLLESALADEPEVPVTMDDWVMIMYTSGATGEAKGVISAQRNLMAMIVSQAFELRVVPEDINLLVMPMFHAGGLWPFLTHFYRGATTVILPRFDEDKVLQTVEKEKITFLNLVPTTLRRLCLRPDLREFDLRSLRMIMYAGAPIPPHQLKEAMCIFGPQRFNTGLGATEASCGGLLNFDVGEHALVLDGPLAGKFGSVGRDSMGVEVIIVDENSNAVPPGQVGEIIARADHVGLGYWKMPEETARTFRNGWLHTGDLGYRDEDAYVFIVGRRKDIIISGGENVSSLEVENVVTQHPAVAEAAVIGVADETWGEAVKAVVALRPGFEGTITAREIIGFCKERLAGYKCPKSVDFIKELPKNPAGKVKKGDLKDRYRV